MSVRPAKLNIDAHQHFLIYDPLACGWITSAMASIQRDFLLYDLYPVVTKAGITGPVAVQARQTVAETDWLLSLAERHPALIRGVVGW
jgi:L-fuconolactonase